MHFNQPTFNLGTLDLLCQGTSIPALGLHYSNSLCLSAAAQGTAALAKSKNAAHTTCGLAISSLPWITTLKQKYLLSSSSWMKSCSSV